MKTLSTLLKETFDLNTSQTGKQRPISTIAKDISKDWKNVNYSAKPYLEAMYDLEKITDNYYADSALSVVSYFLANAGS